VRDQGDLVLLACPGQGTREGLKQIGGEPNVTVDLTEARNEA